MKTMAEFTKQLKEELLEVVILVHTEEETQKSVFHRRMSLKPIQRKLEVYIQGGTSQKESCYYCYESEGIGSVLQVTVSHDVRNEAKGVRLSHCRFQTGCYHIGMRGSERKKKGERGASCDRGNTETYELAVGDDELSRGEMTRTHCRRLPREGAHAGGLHEITWLVLDLSCGKAVRRCHS